MWITDVQLRIGPSAGRSQGCSRTHLPSGNTGKACVA